MTTARLKQFFATATVRLALVAAALADAVIALVFDTAAIAHQTLISPRIDSVVLFCTMAPIVLAMAGGIIWLVFIGARLDITNSTPPPRQHPAEAATLLADDLARVGQEEEIHESNIAWVERVAKRLAEEGWRKTSPGGERDGA